MLIAFQILLLICIFIGTWALFGDERVVSSEDKGKFLAVVLASVIAETVTFFIN